MLTEILGIGAVIGGVIGIFAYIPQITHLLKVKDSTGVSAAAWGIWLFGNLLLLAYAISIKNYPYIIVETLFCTANIALIILTKRYQRK